MYNAPDAPRLPLASSSTGSKRRGEYSSVPTGSGDAAFTHARDTRLNTDMSKTEPTARPSSALDSGVPSNIAAERGANMAEKKSNDLVNSLTKLVQDIVDAKDNENTTS